MQTRPAVRPAVAARAAALATCLAFGSVAPTFAQDVGDAPAAETVEFKLNVKPGQRFGYRQTMNMDQKVVMPAGAMTTKIRQTTDQVMEVLKVAADGAVDVRVRTESIKGSMENPMMGDVEFDSTKPDNKSGIAMVDAMVSAFTMLAGKSYELTLEPTGALREIRGLREIMEEAMGADVSAMLDDDALRAQMASQFPSGVGEQVALGHKWEVVSKLPVQGVGMLEMTARHHLAGATADATEVRSRMDFKLLGGGDAPFELRSSKGEGNMRVSRADGFVLSSEGVTDMAFDMETEMGDVTMEQRVDTKVERVRLPAQTGGDAAETPKAPAGTEDE
jgi:hypothetical protein